MGAGREEKGYVYITEPVEGRLRLGLGGVLGGGGRKGHE